MKDTHEANLPTEENGKLEETKAPETTPENTAEVVVTNETPDAGVAAEETSEAEVKTDEVAAGEETVATTGKLSKEEILEKLTGLVGAAADTTRNEVEALKQAYYKIHRSEVDELKKAFLTAGGEEKDFVAPEDETESKIKELLNVYKEKRAAILAEEERVKAANYALKLQLIDQLKALTESQEDFNKLYNDFKDIQQRWKEVKAVPQEHVSELWKNYQIYSEKFYDIIKINNQFRDYDFKKNLEMKTALCETVEKLQTEPDVVSAFHQLQKLHQQWREIGPVAKELREELWSRFKAASTIINKRHQEHFEGLKAKEQENLEAKTAICEQIENIDFQALKSFKDWEEKNLQITNWTCTEYVQDEEGRWPLEGTYEFTAELEEGYELAAGVDALVVEVSVAGDQAVMLATTPLMSVMKDGIQKDISWDGNNYSGSYNELASMGIRLSYANGSHYLTLNNVNMNSLYLSNWSNWIITLEGTNTLDVTTLNNTGTYALMITEGTIVTIKGNGTLNAYGRNTGSGIEIGGTLTIESGTINASASKWLGKNDDGKIS